MQDIDSIKVMRLQENDVLVVKIPHPITQSTFTILRDNIARVLPEHLKGKIKILIADKESDIEIIRSTREVE